MIPPKNPAMSAFYPAGLKIENLFRNYLYTYAPDPILPEFFL